MPRPHPAIRIQKTKSGSTVTTRVSTLHRDGLGSVRAVTTGAGLKAERAVFRPFGEEQAVAFDLAILPETKGYIGERYDSDADAGLQYLNARYYDPRLGMFVQPDWWEVTEPGVGTNRYGYAGGDPVNTSDPGGHLTVVIKGTETDDDDERYRPGSEFLSAIEKSFGETPEVLPGKLENTRASRRSFARLLDATVRGHSFEDGEQLNIITHSYAGNVANEYTQIDGSRRIDTLVTLGLPHRKDHPLNPARVGLNLNVYSLADGVVPRAGGEDGSVLDFRKYAPAGMRSLGDGAVNVDATYFPEGPESRCAACLSTYDARRSGHSDLIEPEIWNHYVAPTLFQNRRRQ